MKNKNIIFITFFILILIFIGIFNYIMDPYGLRNDDEEFCMLHYPRNMYATIIKAKKDKYKNLIIGGSTAKSMFYWTSKEKVAQLFTDNFGYEDMRDYLELYLNLHPEIEILYLPIEYSHYFKLMKFELPEVDKSTELSYQDLFSLYFSLQATERSFKKLYSGLISDEDKKSSKEAIFVKKYPIVNYNFLRYFDEGIYESLDYIFDLAKRKNLKVICFIPPYHALLQSQMYIRGNQYKIEKLKRYIVKKNGTLLDFAIVNRFTTIPIDENLLYVDIVHPIALFGCLTAPYLYADNPALESEIHFVLNKDNVDVVLEKERKELENYMNANRKYVDSFFAHTVKKVYFAKNSETKVREWLKSRHLYIFCPKN